MSAPVVEDETVQACIKEIRDQLDEYGQTAVGDHDIRRFLVARQMNVPKALEMLNEYLDWRKREKVDALPPLGSPTNPHLYGVRGYKNTPDLDPNMDLPNFPPFLKYCGGGCYHKFDKEGHPIFIERIGKYDAKKLASKAKPEAFVDHHIRVCEFVFGSLMKEASEHSGKIIDKQTVIFDCTGMGMHQFHMPVFAFLRALADHDSKYYPERLGKLFLVNSPALFTKVWGILDKVHILGADAKEVMLNHIDEDSLPAFLGGKCTCSHMASGCVPTFSILAGSAAVEDDNVLDFTGALKDPRDPHIHEITIPMEELVVSNKPWVTYKFKSQKRPVQFEIRHRKWGAAEDVSVLAANTFNSHDDTVQGKIPGEPGFYSFVFTKVSRGGIAGVEYSVDVQFESLTSSEASGRPSEDDDEDDVSRMLSTCLLLLVILSSYPNSYPPHLKKMYSGSRS
ncbi:CRAL-TRIO domain-containing protein [Chytridium lagenaria]|nr:CRAL-TRIO domain-containing protein [Chytridium lagenaria]